MAGYEMANARPRHLLLAKLATAVVPLFEEALVACRELPRDLLDTRMWIVYLKGWSLLMASKAEYHESVNHAQKQRWGMELARLENALSLAQSCQDLINSMPVGIELPGNIHQPLEELLQILSARYPQAQQDHADVPIPPPHEVREIRGELLQKETLPLPRAMLVPDPSKPPLFRNLLCPQARAACESFRNDMEQLIEQMAEMVESKTEAGRQELAAVHLPHSLTAYKQEQSGGGIPQDLWERVEEIQQMQQISKLKGDLWELRDTADQARSLYDMTSKQLDEDVTMDSLFRQEHPQFGGHNVQEVQRSFRSSLANYHKLLAKSQEGDNVLLRRLEILDTDPKYKLLQFQKTQLDRLLPGSAGQPPVDTTQLSRLLVELSTLFHEREVTLALLREEVKNYDIKSKVADIDPTSPHADREYQQAILQAQKSFSGIVYEIQLNLDKQAELIEEILAENEHFMAERDSGQAAANSAANDSCIAMIEDAIDEIQQLIWHLSGGRSFYNVVIPKLEALKQQVGDASVRLAVERCEYEDQVHSSENRQRQELEDARMAAALAAGGPTPAAAGAPSLPNDLSSEDSESKAKRPQSQPGIINVSHGEPQVHVDDEKVASLVAMDFDPAKVVAALKKYDNNVEQALNELLSSS